MTEGRPGDLEDSHDYAVRLTEEIIPAICSPETPHSQSRRAEENVSKISVGGAKASGSGLYAPTSEVSDYKQLLEELPRINGVDYNDVLCYLSKNIIDPKSDGEAIGGPDEEAWREAIATEIDNLRRRDVEIEVKRPDKLGKLLGTKYVFKTKFKHGQVDKCKSPQENSD